MQIQRIQTVYIFLAIVAMAFFMVVPYGEVVALGQTPVATVIILLLVDMFLFRNMPLQRTVLVISFMITLAVIATVCFTLFKEARAEGMDAHFSVWDILLPAAALFELLGIRGIMKDIKLLNSYNRLR